VSWTGKGAQTRETGLRPAAGTRPCPDIGSNASLDSLDVRRT
jgi:hypothetical protein